jgi:hypothetical protein
MKNSKNSQINWNKIDHSIHYKMINKLANRYNENVIHMIDNF